MKRIVTMVILMIVFSTVHFGHVAEAIQPEASYWYPDELLDWNPDTDPDSAFNKSTIPLVDRIDDANIGPKLVALSAMNPTTSGVPSQGGDSFYSNTFSYWQYVDLMVYWAGSAGEGVITPPSADVINNAHRNGVPILGNVFFPPKVYGGQDQWVEQMLKQEEDGSFPAADQLLKVAAYYGFDGWFINQETEGGTPEDAKKMQEFLIYLQDNKPEQMQIMWYDSMVDNGSISWQNYLTDRNKMFLQEDSVRVSDQMFLNFWWSRDSQKRSALKAEELGRSKFDLYSGIDVEANGYETSVNWRNIFPDGQQAFTSLGIYRPDWAYKSSNTMKEFYEKEEKFWIGAFGNPEKTDFNPESWKGMAHYFNEQSVINSMPFVTNFNTGSGMFYNVDGVKKSESEWNNRSIQDVLPTWRWKTSDERLSLNFTWDDSYIGGSAIEVKGDLPIGEKARVDLYKTNLQVDKNTEFSFIHKTFSDEKLWFSISFSDEPNKVEKLELKKNKKGKWITNTLSLKRFSGRTIESIGIEVEGNKKPAHLYLGELSLYNKQDKKHKVQPPENAEVNQTVFNQGIYADIRASWTVENDAEKYEVYRIKSNGERELEGISVSPVIYLENIKRDAKEETTVFQVNSVNKAGVRSKDSVQFSLNWPAYPAPVAEFSSDRTVAAPGQTIQFTSLSSEVTEELQWTFEGASIEASSESAPIVSYPKEGSYSVTLTAKNSEGQDTVKKEGYITITEGAADIRNLALLSTASSSGQCAATEGPDYAIDGKVTDNSKWCAIGDGNWLEIDLGASYQLSEFRVFHAGSGGEPDAFNTRAYDITISEDGQNWTEVVNESQNILSKSLHTIPLTKARYIKLSIKQPAQGADKAARIYEFEAYGF